VKLAILTPPAAGCGSRERYLSPAPLSAHPCGDLGNGHSDRHRRRRAQGLPAGHGAPLRQPFRTHRDLNRLVCDVAPDTLYATLFYAHIDPARRTFHYVSAGHEPALLARRRTGRLLRLERTGTVLGLSGRVRFEERMLPFEPGDTLVAVSEGVGKTVDLPQVLRMHGEASTGELIGRILGAARGTRDLTAAVVRYSGNAVGQVTPAWWVQCLLPTG
jgi:hypothetical protein